MTRLEWLIALQMPVVGMVVLYRCPLEGTYKVGDVAIVPSALDCIYVLGPAGELVTVRAEGAAHVLPLAYPASRGEPCPN